MFANYFKIAYRTLLRYKAYTATNIFGLAVGIALCAGSPHHARRTPAGGHGRRVAAPCRSTLGLLRAQTVRYPGPESLLRNLGVLDRELRAAPLDFRHRGEGEALLHPARKIAGDVGERPAVNHAGKQLPALFEEVLLGRSDWDGVYARFEADQGLQLHPRSDEEPVCAVGPRRRTECEKAE